MAQYSKNVFNLAPGLGRALHDPREDEARAREASARAERELQNRTQQQFFSQMLAQKAQNDSNARFEHELAQRNASMAQQDRHFQQGQAFQGEQADQQRAFQEMLQRMGIDAGARESALGREFSAAQNQLGRDFQAGQSQLNREQAQSNADRGFAYQQDRDSVQDALSNRRFGYQQGRDAIMDQRYADDRAFQQNAVNQQRTDAAREQVLQTLIQSGIDLRSGPQTQQQQDAIRMLQMNPAAAQALQDLYQTSRGASRQASQSPGFFEGVIREGIGGRFSPVDTLAERDKSSRDNWARAGMETGAPITKSYFDQFLSWIQGH